MDAEETLAAGKGSCRDSAWVLVQLLRNLGFAARFVSGYLIQLVADVKPLEGPEGPTADFTDLHAWAEVYLPGAGWIGLDATSGLMTGEGHIPLAASPEPQSAAADLRRASSSAKSTFDFAMTVRAHRRNAARHQAVHRRRRGRTSWPPAPRRSRAGGRRRAAHPGRRADLRRRDRQDAAEWNTDALGPTKRGYAGQTDAAAARRCGARGGAAIRQGKQYPGEQLPRWALHAHWRADGETVWRDPACSPPDGDTDRARRPTPRGSPPRWPSGCRSIPA